MFIRLMSSINEKHSKNVNSFRGFIFKLNKEGLALCSFLGGYRLHQEYLKLLNLYPSD